MTPQSDPFDTSTYYAACGICHSTARRYPGASQADRHPSSAFASGLFIRYTTLAEQSQHSRAVH